MTKIIQISAVLFALCFISLPLNAQLEVQASGDVKASKDLEVSKVLQVKENIAVGAIVDTTAGINIERIIPVPTSNYNSPRYGLKSHIKTHIGTPTSPCYSIYGYADSFAPNNSYGGNPIAGVVGYAYKSYQAPSTFSAGLIGLTYYYGGVGVYGAIGSGGIPTTLAAGSLYAGLFDGTVKVNGTLIVTATSLPDPDQQRGNPQTVSSSMLENIQQLQPVSYMLNQDTVWQYDKEATELQGVHYGLRAKDVENVFPELVYKRGDNLSINYIELIPLLVKTIQELSAEVEKLKTKNKQ